MKKIIVAAGLLIVSATAFSQTTAPTTKAVHPNQQVTSKVSQANKELPPAEKRAVVYSNELKQKLTLTDDQYKKVLAVNTECIHRKDALKANPKKEGQGTKDIAMYRQQQYQAILTSDQLTKLKAINTQKKGNK